LALALAYDEELADFERISQALNNQELYTANHVRLLYGQQGRYLYRQRLQIEFIVFSIPFVLKYITRNTLRK
jgi:hypothetical protein